VDSDPRDFQVIYDNLKIAPLIRLIYSGASITMLKLTYTEAGLHLEKLDISLEEFVTNRMLLSLRSGSSIHIESSRAAFLLTADVVDLLLLKSVMSDRIASKLSVDKVDDRYVEVCFSGTWIANDLCAEEGTLVTALGDRVEFYLYKLWKLSESALTFANF